MHHNELLLILNLYDATNTLGALCITYVNHFLCQHSPPLYD